MNRWHEAPNSANKESKEFGKNSPGDCFAASGFFSSPVISSKDRDAHHLCLFLFIGKRKTWTGDTRLQILRTKRAKNLEKTVRWTVSQRVGSFQVRLSAASKETSCFLWIFCKIHKKHCVPFSFPQKATLFGDPEERCLPPLSFFISKILRLAESLFLF